MKIKTLLASQPGTTRKNLVADLLITLLFIGLWMWFAWQRGYGNSPDSWYRGALAKSIIEGHPYWINFKQGWAYEFSAWHHDAAHPPFLPMLYALFFLLFGQLISAANITVSFAAGLALFPLLRLSRRICGKPWAGFMLYCWIAFNGQDDFLFEVFSGLSFPVTVAACSFVLFFFWQVITRREPRYMVGGIISLACYFYVRPGEQLMFFGFLASSLSLGWFFLGGHAWKRLAITFGGAFALALPWLARNLIVFGTPFFTPLSPLLWTDRAYDYWTYHEKIPMPSSASYFATHSLHDFWIKTLTTGQNYVAMLNNAAGGQLAWYGALLVACLGAIFLVKNRRKQYFLLMLAILLLGYSLIHTMVPLIDRRYMIMPLFCLLAFVLFTGSIPGMRLKPVRCLILASAAILFGIVQFNFWVSSVRPQLTFLYNNSDSLLRNDRTIKAIKNRLGPKDVVLGRISDVQRLNFATGVTFVEAPDNLQTLHDPAAFFRRYQIRYSLVDVSRILPDDMIEHMEMVGDMPLFVIRLAPGPCEGCKIPAAAIAGTAPAKKGEAIAPDKRLIYIDTYHGGEVGNLDWLEKEGGRAKVYGGDLVENRERLLNSGLLLIRYMGKKPDISDRELAVVDEFIAKGGRIVLLCPAWVAASYDNKSLQDFTYNRIAQKFGMLILLDSSGSPFTVTPGFGGGSVLNNGDSTFSQVLGKRSDQAVAVDANGVPVAMAGKKDGARLVLWGHDNLLEESMVGNPEGRRLVKQIFEWLWSGE